MSPRNRRSLAGLAMACSVLAADQASKAWILYGLKLPDLGSIAVLPFLNFTMVWNHGVTFGLFTSQGRAAPYLLGGIALVVVIALGVWLRGASSLRIALPIGAVAGGAIGNIIDRLRFGAVEDFIHAHALGYSWYVFNVADAAIVCGVAMLMLDTLIERRAAGRN
ncbi:MAG: signal peptidase II [Acidocella sp.]|nr:signal peptidase II [Acidocella sp.]